jgi:DNA (cytosine-5)-methyltransferase 1
LLTVEPLRFTLALRPRWVALEQVPAVLELWSVFAGLLSAHGYHTAAGILSAERYGVPQTRKRAFLVASLDGPVQLPPPTHRSYNSRRAEIPDDEHGLEPWISMAQALGWPASQPASGLTARARSWTRRPCDWAWRNGTRGRACVRFSNSPAPTLLAQGGQTWTRRRPATTVACDRRVQPPGHKENASDPPGRYQQRRGVNAVRVTVEQAAVLQGFPADFPWQGAQTRQFMQIGNAVPPPLARAVLEQAIAASCPERRISGRAR